MSTIQTETSEVSPGNRNASAPAPRRRGRPSKHTVLPGDKVAKPTEMDMLASATIPDESTATDEETSTLEKAEALLGDITAIKADGQRWNSYSAFQRYAMLGAAVALQQVLQLRDFHGKPANFNQLLGVNIRTHRAVGANAAAE